MSSRFSIGRVSTSSIAMVSTVSGPPVSSLSLPLVGTFSMHEEGPSAEGPWQLARLSAYSASGLGPGTGSANTSGCLRR